VEQRLCTGCGKSLNKPRPNQRYHDSKCKQAAYRARDNPIPNGPPLVVLAGVDTLYLNVYYADPERYTRIEKPLDEDLQAFFTETQRMAKTSHKEVEMDWMLDEQPLYMLSHGSGKQWHWIMRNDLLNMQIGTGDYRGLIAHVRVSSEYLWRINAIHRVLGIINGLANRIFAHEMVLVPSAIDLCADIANWPMSSIDHLALIARARKHRLKFEDESLYLSGEETWNGRKQGTLYVGMRTSPVHGKLYDKLKEIQDGGNKKSWFHDLYKRNGWDGKAPVTRLEISLKREALNDLGIETDFDLMHNLKGLWAYAVGSATVKPWLRYTVPTQDQTQTRWPLHPVWSVVQHAFDSLDETPARELIRLKKQQANIDVVTASLAGYLATRTMLQCEQDGMPVEHIATRCALDDLHTAMQKRWEEKGVTFQQLLQDKRSRYYLRAEKAREVEERRRTQFIVPPLDEEKVR
jgi:hypothetical protein